jgi:hypothetical protein
MGIIIDIVGSLVKVGMEAYQTSQLNEAEALAKLDAALINSRAKVHEALQRLGDARADADAILKAAIAARR